MYIHHRCDSNHNSMETSLKLGRVAPVRVVTIFAAAAKSEDDKRHLLAYDGLLEIHDLDPNRDLIPQWEDLSLPPEGPDLIVTKLHKAIGSKDTDHSAATILSNYESLRRRHRDLFQRLELAALEKELVLANRFPMQDLIDKVCDAVNLALKCGQPEEQRSLESRLRSSLTGKLLAASGIRADSLGGGDRCRSLCRKPPSIQVESPAESFAGGAVIAAASEAPGSAPASDEENRRPLALPPFPLIVKPCSTAVKSMAMVVDEAALRHFSEGIGRGGVVIEQFVQHDNVICKIYVIGKEIWVVRRPSLPNVTSFSVDAVRQFGTQVGGTFVPLEKSSAGGYVVFLSNKMPKSHISSKPLEECDDLDVPLFRLLTAALARELGVDVFGFDALVESQTKNVFVVDVNFLPGYKGIPSSNSRLSEWLAFLATRLAFKADCRALLPQDLLALSLRKPSTSDGNDDDDDADDAAESTGTRVEPESLSVTPITGNRLFEVTFKETALHSASSSTRHTLVKFFPLNVPRRFVADKDHFMRNIAVGLAARGLAPPFIKDVSAVYFGRRRHLGTVRQWVEGRTLHQLVVGGGGGGGGGKDGSSLGSDRLFADLGVALARFHLLADDADFRRGVIERHFPSAAPMALLRLEEWRRGALLSLVCSPLGESPLWGVLYRDVIEAGSDVVRVVGAAVGNLKTAEALRPVFGHNDCAPSNIVVRDAPAGGDSDGVYLIDEEWAAPNLAIYDFANFVMAMTLLRLRGLADISILRSAVRTMAAKYLQTLKTESPEREGGRMNDAEGCSVDAFVDDVWTFVPVAALTHCFSNLIHASKEGQLTTAIPVDDALHDREGTFNWLRHASDHISVFREYSQSFQNGI